MLGVDYALRCGAKWIEVDVQLTADGTPLLCHDPTLERSSRFSKSVACSSTAEVQQHGAWFADRFGTRFRGVPFATLEQLCIMIRDHNARNSFEEPVRLFVELKGESAQQFGHQHLFDLISSVLARHAKDQDIGAVISMDAELCERIRSSRWPCGWVFSSWNADTRQKAEGLAPEFLFCNVKQFPKLREDVWQGPWRWVIYTVNDVATARAVMAMGVDLIETDCIDLFVRALGPFQQEDDRANT